MEFNVIDENNQFKFGNIISIFKLSNNEREFALFSVGEYDKDESSLHVAYLNKDSEGYDYIEEIDDDKTLKQAIEAIRDIIGVINNE